MKGKDGLESVLLSSYTKTALSCYDRERHISMDNAHSLVSEAGLEVEKLKNAIEQGLLKVYEFKGEKFLDRLDIGRVYAQKANMAGLKIERYFTDGKKDPFDTVEYEIKKLEIKDSSGKVIFSMDAEFPKGWSDVAAAIVAQKYFFKPKNELWKEKIKEKLKVRDYEFSLKHLINRVTNFIAEAGFEFGYFKSEEDKKAFAEELKWMQLHRMFAFNSPVQFNAGLYTEYGIKGSGGKSFWRNPINGNVVEIVEGEYLRPQCHACFIKGPRDDLESLMQHVRDEGAIFSAGSGIGQDLSNIRAEGEPLSGGGSASGPLSFFKIYDNCAGTIKSGGKSRRAARMTTIRYNHPDVMKFIMCKTLEDKKALVLMKNGYSPGMDGEAYTTVAFQNTNISIRLDEEFFKKLERGEEIELKRVTDGKVVEKIPADYLLKAIAFGSWRVGDPGVQYETEIQRMHTCKNSGRINSSNPCSEYMFLNDTSCNLASTNLLAFADEKGNFDVEKFKRANKLIAIALDIINDAASYPIRDIAETSPEFRTIGIGYANLGALLMRKGIPYDSEKGRAFAAAIAALMTGSAYEMSAEMAKELGSFVHYEFNKKPMLEVLKRHAKYLDDIAWDEISEEKALKSAVYDTWEKVVKKGEEYGFRNAQVTVLAPTGTISYLMDCDTTGIEPAIALRIQKDLAGGGTVVIVNREVLNALTNLGYSQSQITDISNYIKERNTVIGAPHLSPSHYGVFATAFGNEKGEGAISFEGHVRMVGAVQKFISGAISKTNNLPETATVKEIYDGYILGYKLGLKALAIFRNNSKPISPLNFGNKSYVELKRGEKEDLPSDSVAHEWEVKIGGVPFHVNVREYPDGRPGQIVLLSYKSGHEVPTLLSINGITISKALKRGVSLEEALDGWLGHKFEPHGIVSGHAYIKTATSPLDFAAKLLLLEYLGKKEFATNPEDVKVEELRGFKNGAFRTYRKMSIADWDWDIQFVLNDPEVGGFIQPSQEKPASKQSKKYNGTNTKGVSCRICGALLRQVSSNCYECENCGERVGGCGQ
ncbi:MAG: vitamin B12-dependent ribonucleotide reductase [Candidatus Woesearchaeota archaeon]